MAVTAGSLEEFGVLEIVQTLVLGMKTAQIDVSPQGSQDVGTIYVWRGRVVHATTRTDVGADAFHEILSWTHGTWVIEADAYTEQRTIHDASIDAQILEVARRTDEDPEPDDEPE